jgi:nitrous oxidase accessory protein NosD
MVPLSLARHRTRFVLAGSIAAFWAVVAAAACSSSSAPNDHPDDAATPSDAAADHVARDVAVHDAGSHDSGKDAPAKDVAPTPVLKPSGPLTITGGDGGVISGLAITSTTGDCVTITNAHGFTLRGNDIGPCAGNAVVVSGGDTVTLEDNYIHPEHPPKSCCDTGDGVFAHGTSTLAILGNVIAYGEANIEVNTTTGVRVIGNFLLNPQNGGSRGQNFQAWGGCSDVDVEDNYTLSSLDSKYTFPAKQEDSINFGLTTGITAKNNYVTGGTSPSGCGIIADDQAESAEFQSNVLYNAGQCGIGIASGTNQNVSANKILDDTPVEGGGNTGLYVWNQYDAACGPVSVVGNVVSAIKPDGTQSAYWYGGGCDPVSNLGNTFGDAATAELTPPSTKLPPPPIPPSPVTCVAPSPYVNNTSLPSCGKL